MAVEAPAVGGVAVSGATGTAPFIPPPGDGAGLGAALLQLAEDEILRRRVGAANLLRAREAFDEGVMAGKHAALYAAALGLPSFP